MGEGEEGEEGERVEKEGRRGERRRKEGRSPVLVIPVPTPPLRGSVSQQNAQMRHLR